MKIRTLTMTAGLLGMGLVTSFAQQPMYDRVHVNLPYTVNVGDRTLPPGEYTIQQNRDPGGGARILLIYSENGMKFETSAMSIPALDQNTPNHTELILGKIGDDYYLDKMWVQGKDYGYELPVPSRLKERQKEMTSVTVPGNYSSSSETTTSASNESSQTKSEATNEAAQVQPANPQQATTPANPPAVTDTTPMNHPATTSTNSADRMADQSSTQPATTPAAPTTTTTDNSADRSATDNTPSTMPATSAGWLMMLLGGGSLSSLGLALRRKR